MAKPTSHTHPMHEYPSTGYQCCQDYRYAVCIDPQGNSCAYVTYHAAPCFTASTSQSVESSTLARPTPDVGRGDRYDAYYNPYENRWDASYAPMHEEFPSQMMRSSISPAESSDSDFSYMAQDEMPVPTAAESITYNRSALTEIPSFAAAAYDPATVPTVYPMQQLPSHIPHHVNAASHSSASTVLTSTASHLDFDLSPSIASVQSQQTLLSDITPSTASLPDVPIPIHHPRPRRLFLNRLLTESVSSDEEPVSEECREPEAVQNHPLSPHSLLCQPAPPSVMFPDSARHAMLANNGFDPGISMKDASSCFHYPYDVDELTQNVVVCSCGCMGSYLMT